ncbi:sulfotransferase domain-containing protein [Kordiimonas lipolytica]|uniref:Sulfotransferase domain-containing protein n=1 Tax=Kordiimonas lipolytica TaxID=1662421 RepID=A0ABV8U5H6_9PROT|nr:sulfotransferase domain-containing protein [Kordiimonas lipolytica]
MLRRLADLIFPSEPPIRCVGTYHKTGTVWMRRVFKDIAKAAGAGFVDLRDVQDTAFEPDHGTIYLEDHTAFPEPFLTKKVRGIRIIRDPRDVVISGAHYHGKSVEPWLHEAKPFFDGKTYAEMINSFDAMVDRYRFEMDNVAADTIAAMTDAKGDSAQQAFLDRNFLTVRYEDLIEDTELAEFRKICRYLKLPFRIASPAFLKHSLFNNKNAVGGHGRSGKKQQWKTVFDQALGRAFAEKHQQSLEILGYEKDDSWIERLKP